MNVSCTSVSQPIKFVQIHHGKKGYIQSKNCKGTLSVSLSLNNILSPNNSTK